jgi:hypothetical protein
VSADPPGMQPPARLSHDKERRRARARAKIRPASPKWSPSHSSASLAAVSTSTRPDATMYLPGVSGSVLCTLARAERSHSVGRPCGTDRRCTMQRRRPPPATIALGTATHMAVGAWPAR